MRFVPGCNCCGPPTFYAGCGSEGSWPDGFYRVFKIEGETTGSPGSQGYYPDLALDVVSWSRATGTNNCWISEINRTQVVVNYWLGTTWGTNANCFGGSQCCWAMAETNAASCINGSGCTYRYHAGVGVSVTQEIASGGDLIMGEPTRFLRPVCDFICWDQVVFGIVRASASVTGQYQSPRGNPADAIKISGTWYVPPVPLDFAAGVSVPVTASGGSGGGIDCFPGNFTLSYGSSTVLVYSP